MAWLETTNDAFAVEFRRYIDEYGHLIVGQSIAQPTYAEMPSFLIATIKHQVATGFEPGLIDTANRDRRDETIEKARTRLSSALETLDEFDTALHRAAKAYPVR